LKALKDRHAEQVAGVNPTAVQASLQSIQSLLLVPVPVLDPEKRAQLVETRRRIEKSLHDGSTPMGSDPQPPRTDKVRRRAEALAAAHGDADWKQTADRELRLPDLAAAVKPLQADKFDPAATPAAAAAAAAHARGIAAAAVADKPEQRVAAERFSRVAVAPADPPTEPAVFNRMARWKALLEGQAARVARDHWYDEDGKPVFATIADAFLNDAAELAKALGGPPAPPSGDARDAEALKKVPPLDLAADVAGGAPAGQTVRWTTESARDLRLAVTRGGPPLTGSAVVWAASADPAWLAVPGGGRDPFALPASVAPAEPRKVRIEPGPTLRDVGSPDTKYVTVAAEGYFRGQRLKYDTRFAVNSRPDLVVTETQPDPGAMIALRAADDLEPGAVSIVLDFSGSMASTPTEGLNPAKTDWQKNPQTKMAQAVDTLREVLKDLPRRTRVSIRVFSHVTDRLQPRDQGRPFTEKVFPFADGSPVYADRAADVYDRLRSFYPWHDTPLVDAIREAVADTAALPDTDDPQTLIVLTDGANTRLGGDAELDVEKPGWVDRVRREVRALKRDLRPNLAVHMVFFSAGKEEQAAFRMFEDLEDLTEARAAAGKLWRADGAAELKRRLDRILRPKPRLLHPGGRRVEEVPPYGMPVNRMREGPGELFWYGPRLIETAGAEAYTLEFAKARTDLRVAAGDRMVIRLGTDPDRRVTFTREVYYRDVDRVSRGNRATDEHPDWFLSVPWYTYERGSRHYLMATAALEAKDRTTDGGDRVLRQPRPQFLWWELTRLDGANEQAPEGTVFVRNVVRRQFPAPAWRVIADDGPTAKMETAKNRLRAFVRTDQDLAPIVGHDVPDPARLDGAPLILPPKDEPVTVQVGLETIAFYPDPAVDPIHTQEPGAKKLCLVVRATDARGRLLHARVRGLGDFPTREHRYFYQREGKEPRPQVAGYTAVFGPLKKETLAALPSVRIELASVTALMADPKAEIVLNLDSPNVGQRSPQVIEPGSTDLGLR
jgi:hypothetical protein